jgi:hypothetical protein
MGQSVYTMRKLAGRYGPTIKLKDAARSISALYLNGLSRCCVQERYFVKFRLSSLSFIQTYVYPPMNKPVKFESVLASSIIHSMPTPGFLPGTKSR